MDLALIIPAYNEASIIGEVLARIPESFDGIARHRVIVVDDGSTDGTDEVARHHGAVLLRHPINRGLGGALGTGLTYVRQESFDLAVTLDADGQHAPEEIDRLLRPLIEGRADVVVGSRLIDSRGMPVHRVLGNRFLNLVTFLLFGIWTTDSQSGFRGFSAKAIELIRIRTSRMEVSSEFFSEVRRHHLRLAEVQVTAIYTEYSMSKGQSYLNALSILRRLFFRRFLKH